MEKRQSGAWELFTRESSVQDGRLRMEDQTFTRDRKIYEHHGCSTIDARGWNHHERDFVPARTEPGPNSTRDLGDHSHFAGGLTHVASTRHGAEQLSDAISRQDPGMVDNISNTLS